MSDLNQNQRRMLQITREDGRVNHIGIAVEKGFMLNILNKTDKKVVKVERGILTKKGETKTFESTETIYQSAGHETKELARQSLALAKEKDAENQMLKAELEALKSGGAAEVVDAVKAELEQQKVIAGELAAAKNAADAAAQATADENAALKAELEKTKAELQKGKKSEKPA